MVSVKEVYQYPDAQSGDEDVFAREPFVVWFSSPKTGKWQTSKNMNSLLSLGIVGLCIECDVQYRMPLDRETKTFVLLYILEVKDFVIIPIHTVPEAAVREIDELYDVVSDVQQRWTSEV